MSFVVLTPRLAPAHDGLGHYMRQLWQRRGGHLHTTDAELPEATKLWLGEKWKFLVLDGAQESQLAWPEVEVHNLNKVNLVQQLESLDAKIVFLQFVGYAFDPKGAPFWLADSLNSWKIKNPGRHVVIMFHEAWSDSPPWRAAFWHKFSQKRCLYQLLKLASRSVTSINANADSLKVLQAQVPIDLIPIACTISASSHYAKDWRSLLIFGKRDARLRALRIHGQFIKKLIAANIVDKIVLAGQSDIGIKDTGVEILENLIKVSTVPGTQAPKIHTEFNFPLESTPAEILSCGLNLMHTQSTCLMKSAGFHLALTAGQVPITLWEKRADPPFEAGVHYIAYSSATADGVISLLSDQKQCQSIAKACHDLGEKYLSWESIADRWMEVMSALPLE